MKAIHVVFRGPTDRLGSRFVARAADVPVLIHPYDHRFDADENARLAAEALCERQGWCGALAMGTLPDGSRCFVFVSDDNVQTVSP